MGLFDCSSPAVDPLDQHDAPSPRQVGCYGFLIGKLQKTSPLGLAKTIAVAPHADVYRCDYCCNVGTMGPGE